MNIVIIIEILIVVITISFTILLPIIRKIKINSTNEYLKENGSIVTARYLTTDEKKKIIHME